jgi:hypothetical protein
MLAKREHISGKPPFRIYKGARKALSRLNSEQISPPLGEGQGRKRGAPLPREHGRPTSTMLWNSMGSTWLWGMYNPTWPKTATVADLWLGRLAENDRFRALSGPNRHPVRTSACSQEETFTPMGFDKPMHSSPNCIICSRPNDRCCLWPQREARNGTHRDMLMWAAVNHNRRRSQPLTHTKTRSLLQKS